ncbi:DNA-3-methyladenine glycosylase [Limisalsivibrio acetivorans]|uniref:DNA-3-methyladenine glycosylase n=1 Tax=Limisalsivibrio acetivorans TaxID=1304888 RepID=UPI0003B41727|nr:DNA-3-methyladenine glycosylase [Limisalsivibrio acetivorans]
MERLTSKFFDRDAALVAEELLGKVIYREVEGVPLRVMVIETECYYLADKGSHASLGYTEKRSPLFMVGGTVYMYYARGGDSLNISSRGEGNAVLIKSGIPWGNSEEGIELMQRLNPVNGRLREPERLCSGQTLLCKSLNLKVPEHSGVGIDEADFCFLNDGDNPEEIIQTTRLGIPEGRDEYLPYRFIHKSYAGYCTKNPLTMKNPPPYSLSLQK